MIGKLAGQYAGEGGDGTILIDVGGVGYVVRVPGSDLFLAGLADGTPVELFIHTAVRDDAIDLYGFPTRETLAFFKLLMSVSSIGPKTALSILSLADTASLKRAIAQGDATILVKRFGIGKKSAERIVVELKDKLADDPSVIAGDSAHGGMPIDAEVQEALESLGYSAAESRRAIQDVPASAADVRARLSAALKNLGTPSQKI